MRLIAKTLYGLEQILAKELEAIGGKNIEILKRAVAFEGDKRLMYRANLELRTALRILMPVTTFQARNEHQLYKHIQEMPWFDHLSLKDTFAIDGVCSSQYFNHSKYVALKSKDAIADKFRDKMGRRPNVNTISPSLRINVHIFEDNVNVSFDSSGDTLHKRAYRVQTMDAPINEVLAAGMIILSGWNADSDFIDPMCGSGTLPIEAAMIAKNVPPNYLRESFGFQKWKDYDAELWEDVRQNAMANIRDFDYKIKGFDKSFKAVRLAESNAGDIEAIQDIIEFKRCAFEKLTPTSDRGVLVMNPPYDVRLEDANITELYGMIGDQLKQQWQGHQAWIISSNQDALKCIGLRPSKRLTLYNGALDCKYQRFDMYAGSKKQKHLLKNAASSKNDPEV